MKAYDAMLAAIDECFDSLEADLDQLPPAQQLQALAKIVSTEPGLKLRAGAKFCPERKVAEIRLRAEYGLSTLLRDAAGLPPRNKRDARWLAGFDEARA